MGGAGIHWASPPGQGDPTILFTIPRNPVLLPTPVRQSWAVATLAVKASGGGSLHLL